MDRKTEIFERMNISVEESAPACRLEEDTVPGLHASLFTRVMKLGLGPDSAALDLGCGSGAWLARLAEAGFSDLTGVEIASNPALRCCPRIITADLDLPLDLERRFQLITAIEVVEHLPRPERVFEHADRLLTSGGWLLVTSPNIYSVRARTRFLLTGRLNQFEANCDPQHIHPLVLEAVKRVILPRYSLELTEVWTYPHHGSDGSRWFASAGARVLGALFGDELPGDCLCLLLRKR